MGADVIKIEPPWGEPWRLTQRFTPPGHPKPESRTFMTYNRGKRSLPLDLTRPEAQEILSRLDQADRRRPGQLPSLTWPSKLGVDYENALVHQPPPGLLRAYCLRSPAARTPIAPATT